MHQRDNNRTQLFDLNYDQLANRASSPYDKGNKLDISQSTLSQLESQNDDQMSTMKEKIGALKSLSLRMGEEIRGSNHTMDQLGEVFEGTSTKLKQTFNKMLIMAKTSRISLRTWLFIFFVVFLLFFWVWIR